VAVASQPIGRGQVFLVRLDHTLGSEIKKMRPCVVVSPDELNVHLRTIIIARRGSHVDQLRRIR
jgi:mRNA interferase MazF